jgi:hypothetical protein
MKKNVLASAVLLATAGLWACSETISPTATNESPTTRQGMSSRVDASGRPLAAFRTTPGDTDGTISGPSPLSVEFNLCQSRPASEDDDLRFTYDFDANDSIDARGSCRATYVYENPNGARHCGTARVCVSDRRPDGEVCRSYEVCVEGGATSSGPTQGPGPVTDQEVEPNDDDALSVDPDPGSVSVHDFKASAANLTSTPPDNLAVKGRIDPSGDEDYFKLANHTNGAFELDISLSCSASALMIVLFDGTGAFVGNDDLSCGATSTLILPANETLFLGLRATDDATAGITYQLKVEPISE